MKYIDAGKLKYEIKRRKLSNYYTDTDDYETELFEIIDSLQQEQQEVDLEEEITNFIQAHYHIRYDNTLENGNDPLTVFDFEDIARHFAKWGAEHLKK